MKELMPVPSKQLVGSEAKRSSAPRQFSLAALMVVVTVVSVLLALAVSASLAGIVVLFSIGATILRTRAAWREHRKAGKPLLRKTKVILTLRSLLITSCSASIGGMLAIGMWALASQAVVVFEMRPGATPILGSLLGGLLGLGICLEILWLTWPTRVQYW